ncbi:Neu5Ac permease [Tritonibacter multivorans]|uniref:Neu5Ac permease n=1 Tax=Tritonibacter multivorans TaxID=928856 RepID=A0A0P1GX68_9RHOB|nr:TRAP transporter large permease subunit [Tritonibacter multivorans]MDA7421126.1 TRAP transporter large permease subunit [Tritonibacter multivorans]CUH80120.1 Neu5Ac permease [Tritonibacter multivorans]SFC74395.1 TRAP-type mannitol/chloroaromatic compound transport system, large permease component [Tritonibacter multivorans]
MAADEVNPDDLEIADELIAERRSEAPGETPEDMTSWQRPITAVIDTVNYRAGQIIALMMVPLIAVVVYEVFMRNSFAILQDAGFEDFARALGLGPTLWVYDTSRMIAGMLFMAAAGYGLMRGVHIRADFLYRNWTEKTQATVDATLYLLFFMPSMALFTVVASQFWWLAFTTGETMALDSAWQPILWPARIAMPIGGFLLFLQGIPETFRAFHKMGNARERVFLRLLPIYVVVFVWLMLAIFVPDVVPGGEWFTEVMKARPGLSKPTIGLIMLATMLFVIFIGFPISFTLIFLGFVFGIWGANFKLTTLLMTLNTNSTMLNDQLMAVPLFVLMGIVMEAAGLMERLFASIQMIMARVRGALFIAVLIVSTIFAAATGIVGASVTLLGIMAGATMSRSGYNVQLAAGTITAGGTLGILIPPSIMLIVMGPVLEVSTLDLFRGAFIPGALLASLYLLYTLGRCWLNPALGPVLAEEDQPVTSRFYGAEVALICLGILTLCRVFGLSLGGSLSGFVPFGGLLLLVATLLVAHRAYRSLTVLRIVLPIAVLFHIAMVFAHIGAEGSLPIGSIIFAGFIVLLAVLARPIYGRDAQEGFYFSQLWDEFFAGLMPPTILISFALGSILLGLATPAEAAAMGAFGAILLSLAYRKFTVPSFFDSLVKALEITVLIMFLVAASNFFGAQFSSLGTPKMMTEILLGLDLSPYLVLLLVMALIFLLGWPLEWVPIVLIVVPILLPTVEQLDIYGLERYDLMVWFGILVAVNLQTAWLSPPVALSAYFLKGVVPNWDLKDIYLGMMQFMLVQLFGLVLLFLFPRLVLWLPAVMSGN